jgi:GEVED domain/Secretion system C-terminal sorting domain
MKQKLLLLFIVLASFLAPKAQLLSESFDGGTFPPTGWSNTQVGGGSNVWERATVTTQTNPNAIPPHSGAGMALYDSYNYLAGESADLATPVLDFSTGGPYKVSFWMYRDSRYTANNDSLEVFVNDAAPTSAGGTKLGGVWRHHLDPPAQTLTGWYQYTFSIPGSFNTATNYIVFRANSDYGTEMVIDDIKVEQNLNCSGTPVGGTASASVPFLCATGNSTLSVSGASNTPGITYQWQSSPAGANTFTDISGATTTTYAATGIAASTDYRLLVTCTNGGAFQYSTIATVTISGGAPANDLVCNAITLTLGGGYDCGNTSCATATGDPSLICSTPNNTVWYKYTPATSGTVDIRMKRNGPTGNLNAWVQFYTATGTCPTLTLTQVNTGTCTGNIDLTVVDSGTVTSPTLTAGTDYYIILDGFSGAVGAYCITVVPPPPPPPCVTNVTPANGATGVTAPAAPITWNSTPTATSYDVFFGTTNPPTANIGNVLAPATTINITGLLNSTTYYWYIVPKNGGSSAVGCSTNVTSFTTAAPPPNCVPAYGSGAGQNCSGGDLISLFRLKGETTELNINTGTACNSPIGYVDSTDHPVIIDMARGKSYWGQALCGFSSNVIAIWIDFDDDGLFETNEKLMNNLTIGTTLTNINLFIPTTAALGNHRMRVRNVFSPSGPIDACALYTYGETEDYTVNIVAGGASYTVATYPSAGTCFTGAGSITVDATSNNNSNYVPLVDSSNALVAQLYPQGNNLGRVNVSYYKHNGAVRQDAGGRYYLDRNLTITVATQPTTPYNLRFPYQNSELNALIAQPGSGVTSQFDLVMTKNGDGCLSAIGTGGTGGFVFSPTGFGSLGSDRFVDVTNITGGFSSFYLHGGSTPIPVNLVDFKVQRVGKVNNASWSTSQEVNTSHFVIERSNDGNNFAEIGRVTANGNSNTILNYSFVDANPVKGINYYRLRVVDRDNSAKFSAIRSVRNEGIADVSIYPNPVNNEMTLTIDADKAETGALVISDVTGKVVATRTITVAQGNNKLPVNTAALASGAYIIKVQLNDDVVVRKFTKQ